MDKNTVSVLNQDIKRLFKICKRDVFNKILNKKGKNPFPDGKHRSRVYEEHLKTTLRHVKDYIVKDLLLNNTIQGPQTKVIENGRYHVHLNIKFVDVLKGLDKHPLSFRYKRLYQCYYCALKCIDINRRSGHEDFTILCPASYRSIMINTFIRFGLNRRCVEVSTKVDRPVILINTDPDEELEVD